MTTLRCTVCGKEIAEVEPCIYNEKFGPTCDECCQKCYETEPFPCAEHEWRNSKDEEVTTSG